MKEAVDQAHGPVDQILAGSRWTNGHGRVTRSPEMASGNSELDFLPWDHREDEGTEGILTTTLVGTEAARFGRATVDRGGGRSFSMGQCLEHGEWELGAGLDAVERWGALGCFI
jgi:hypothetical protein